MQPYFFPYLAHFALIAHTDAWVVFDITQYTPKTWMNRNRILHPATGWNYVTVPLSNSSTSIKTHEARILDIAASHKSIIGKLSHYRHKAPYFDNVKEIVNDVFTSMKNDLLTSLNVQALKTVCAYLNIPFRVQISSEMKLQLPANLEPGEWALEISHQLGASSYINPISGRQLFNPQRFKERDISLYFMQFDNFAYDTQPYLYESNLSVLDVLMWNHPNDVRGILIANSHLVAA
ncbi:WbqC family protein [Dyella acidisoli]